MLALQGACDPHLEAVRTLGLEAREVRAPRHLVGLTHLVLPGGESTTMHHLLELFELLRPISARHRAGELALLGTCAGTILLSKSCGGHPPTLGLLDVEVERNAYGRQVDSFTRSIRIEPAITIEPAGAELHGVFIRAPRFTRIGAGVQVLARADDDPVLVQSPGILAATFHPELAGDPLLHRRFLEPELWTAPAAEVLAS